MDTSHQDNHTVFSLVILCYRGEETIPPFVDKVHALFSWLNIKYELILVGNYWPGSDDKTPDIVKKLAAETPHTRALCLEKKGAMGWDVRSGFDVACGEFVGFIDGDGQFPIDSILPPLYHALSHKVDLAKSYRVVREDGIYRWIISKVFNSLFRLLFHTNYRDVNSKPKIIRAEALKKMKLTSDDWFVDAEIMIRASQLNLRVVECPIHFVENANRASFVKFSAIWEFIKNLYAFRRYKFRLEH